MNQWRRVRSPHVTPGFGPNVLVAERTRRRFPKPVDAGSSPAGDTQTMSPWPIGEALAF